MPNIVIYRGLPGSGKTTAARREQMVNGGTIVGRDHIRDLLFDARGEALDKEREERVTKVQESLIRQALRDGVDVYVDDMNLRSRYVRRLMQIGNSEGATVIIEDYTDAPLKEIKQRNEQRDHPVPEELIDTLYERFIRNSTYPLPIPEIPQTSEHAPYVPDLSKPRAVMVDLDGTLAIKGDRDIYDGSKVYLDSVDPAVALTVDSLLAQGITIIFCSGRSSEYRDVTAQWLWDVAGYDPHPLYMREEGDKRADWKVKLELFDKYIRDEYAVEYVLDDRKQVVDAWRGIGLKVFQVAEGMF